MNPACKDRKENLQQCDKHENFNWEHDCILNQAFHKKVVISLAVQHTAPKASQSDMNTEINDKFTNEHP